MTSWLARSSWRFAALLIAAALFSACGPVGQNFVRPESPVSGQWQGAGSEVVTGKSAGSTHWWQGFNDPVLNGLIEETCKNNYDLKIMGLRVLEARAQLGIASGNIYPQMRQISGGTTYKSASENAANTKMGDLSFWEHSVGATVGWELDFWGKFRRGIEAADAGMLTSIAAYDNALVLLTAGVADTYVLIRTAEEQLRVAKENIELQQRSVEITETRFRNGDVDELDMQQAMTQLLSTKATVPRLRTGLQQAKNAMNTLLGRPPGKTADLLGSADGTIPAIPAEVAIGAPADLLRRRPDIRQAEQMAAAQSALVGVAEADLYPSFGISGFFGVLSADGTDTTRSGKSGLGQMFTTNAITYAGGPYFSWNILNLERLRNNIRTQDARLQQLLVNYQSTVLKAAQEVEDGIEEFRSSREQEEILAKNVAVAKRSLELASLRYREGLSDFQRVLDVQLALLAAQQRLVTARSGSVRSAITIYRALGGGWEIRGNNDFVDQKTKDEMSKRGNWGNLLNEK